MDHDNPDNNKQVIPLEFTGKPSHDGARDENADPDTEIGSSPIDRLSGETPDEWRYMLLWGMVRPKNRSFRLTARAGGCSDYLIRKLHKKHKWDERIKSYGAWGDHQCLKSYCLKAVDANAYESLPILAQHMRKDPIAALGSYAPELKPIIKPRIVPDEQPTPITKAVAQAIVDAGHEVQKANSVDERQAALEMQKRIAGAVISRGVEGLKDGSMRISPKDLQNFMVMSQELMGFSFDQEGQAKGVESVRVRFARDAAEDLLLALRKDLADMNTIAQALHDQREQQKQHDLEVEQERKRLMEELG